MGRQLLRLAVPNRRPPALRSPYLGLILLALLAVPGRAEPVHWNNRFDLYGDHVESRTPFRPSATFLDSQLSTVLEFASDSKSEVRAGLFMDHSSGSTAFADRLRPVLSWRQRTDYGDGIVGTLDTVRRHGLIEPLAAAQLDITRPVEYGAQWLEQSEDLGADVFLNWQRLRTDSQPDRFDYGGVVSRRAFGPWTAELQAKGARDGTFSEAAGGPGLRLSGDLGRALGWCDLAVFGFLSSGDGKGGYARLGMQPGGLFELFGILWLSSGFASSDGDPNYRASRVEELGFRRLLPLSLDSSIELEQRSQWVNDRFGWWLRLAGRLRFRL